MAGMRGKGARGGRRGESGIKARTVVVRRHGCRQVTGEGAFADEAGVLCSVVDTLEGLGEVGALGIFYGALDGGYFEHIIH